METFVERRGICRDYAHLMITLARASGMPARMVSVYAPDVEPPDFHAVAEVFVGGEWRLIDATGMAEPDTMVRDRRRTRCGRRRVPDRLRRERAEEAEGRGEAKVGGAGQRLFGCQGSHVLLMLLEQGQGLLGEVAQRAFLLALCERSE